jgi:hypothetical protein
MKEGRHCERGKAPISIIGGVSQGSKENWIVVCDHQGA